MDPIKAVQKKTKNPNPAIVTESQPKPGCEDKNYRVALRAYYKAEARGYEPGHEIQDWLDAEAEVEAEESKK